ncbi:MAG TPA: hypothetical protein VHL31_00910 [Geminicoccus sp.]|uniref:hypothetical protein n=1 Tax=Geminicoccus sp. TaxID=2024832 RepID=UPI002E2F7FE3|nr:hypothetical protein [Geminicoccus sp.]HEX2524849.1 hypothetical protein [Geminicoccus sp.]
MIAAEGVGAVLERLPDRREGFAVADQGNMVCTFAAQPDDLGKGIDVGEKIVDVGVAD